MEVLHMKGVAIADL